MPAGAIVLTRTLDRVAALAGAVTGFTSRVYQGKKFFDDADNFESVIRALSKESQGAFAFWLDSVEWGNQQYELGEMEVAGLIFLRLDTTDTSDTNTLIEKITVLVQALAVVNNYEAANYGEPIRYGFSPNDDYDEMDDDVSIWNLKLTFKVPMLCG